MASHRCLDTLTGVAHHRLIDAVLAAKDSITDDEFRTVLSLNKRAGKAKHDVSWRAFHPPVGERPCKKEISLCKLLPMSSDGPSLNPLAKTFVPAGPVGDTEEPVANKTDSVDASAGDNTQAKNPLQPLKSPAAIPTRPLLILTSPSMCLLAKTKLSRLMPPRPTRLLLMPKSQLPSLRRVCGSALRYLPTAPLLRMALRS